MVIEIDRDLVSVVIPVYNVEEYLIDCLDSVLEQTYTNLEIVLVDDGSTDDSGKLCDIYSKAYPNIRVIHQRNKGLAAARNTALDQSHGEWIIFVDSDDYLFPDMIRVLHETVITKKVPFVRCGFEKSILLKSEQKPYSLNDDWKDKVRDVKPVDELRDILNEIYMPTVWAAIYHRSLIQGVWFCEGYIYEDVPFMTKILAKTRKMCRVDEKLCVYRHNPKSITSIKCSKHSLDICPMMLKRIKVIKEEFPELYTLSQERFWSKTANVYNKFLDQGSEDLAGCLEKRIREEYLHEYLSWKLVFDQNIPLRRRFALAGYKCSFRFTCRVKRFLIRVWEKYFSYRSLLNKLKRQRS